MASVTTLRVQAWAASCRRARVCPVPDRVAAGDAADWPEHVTATLACHAAVRAGKTLTIEEMRELVRALEQATLPQTCPHGRPTMIVLAAGRLERDFRDDRPTCRGARIRCACDAG